MNGLFKLVAFDWIKGGIVAVLVAVLTYLQQILTEGGQVSIKMILTTSITSLIGYLIKQLMTDNNGQILSMVGGRKKRKKPTGIPQNNTFEFEGNDFTANSIIAYSSDLANELPVTIAALFNGEDTQTIQFNQEIHFTDFESLYFEIQS